MPPYVNWGDKSIQPNRLDAGRRSWYVVKLFHYGKTVFILFKSKVGEVHFSSEQINASTIKWVTVFWLTMQYQSDCLTRSIQNNRLKFDISSQFPPMCNDLFAEASAPCSSLLSQVAPPSNTYWSSNSRYKLVSSLHFHQRSKTYFSWFMNQRAATPCFRKSKVILGAGTAVVW